MAALLSFALPASAASASSSGSLTFAGHCQLTGTVAFSPNVTFKPAVVNNQPTATGTCSGTLTDSAGTAELTNAPVQYLAQELGTAESCESNLNSHGTGELIFQQGALHFSVLENRVSGNARLHFTGAAGGSATGVASVSTSNPLTLLKTCATTGLSSVPVSLTIQTTPTISG